MNLLARIIGNTPGLRDLHWIIRHYHREMHPRGHFYSPLPDIKKYDFSQIGLKRSFCHQKCASKAEKQPILAPYRYHIK